MKRKVKIFRWTNRGEGSNSAIEEMINSFLGGPIEVLGQEFSIAKSGLNAAECVLIIFYRDLSPSDHPYREIG